MFEKFKAGRAERKRAREIAEKSLTPAQRLSFHRVNQKEGVYLFMLPFLMIILLLSIQVNTIATLEIAFGELQWEAYENIAIKSPYIQKFVNTTIPFIFGVVFFALGIDLYCILKHNKKYDKLVTEILKEADKDGNA